MSKFILLAIVSIIHGGICALTPPPSYLATHREVITVVQAIQTNVLSMADHIPPLNDSRRHYAELAHVIYVSAFETGHSCLTLDYKKIVERASAEALTTPEKVVKTAKKVFDDLDENTKTLQELINIVNAIGLSDTLGDSMIDVFVTAAPEHFAEEVKLHFACGEAAKKFNEKKDLFNKLSKELDTHKFIVTEFETLMDIIYAFSEVTKILYPFPILKC